MSTVLPGLPSVQFTVQDLQAPDGIERVLLQIQGQLTQMAQTIPAPADPNTLAPQIFTLLQPQILALINQQIAAAAATPPAA